MKYEGEPECPLCHGDGQFACVCHPEILDAYHAAFERKAIRSQNSFGHWVYENEEEARKEAAKEALALPALKSTPRQLHPEEARLYRQRKAKIKSLALAPPVARTLLSALKEDVHHRDVLTLLGGQKSPERRRS